MSATEGLKVIANSNSPFHVLITDRFSLDALARLQSHAKLKVHVSQTPLPSDDELKTTQALIIRSRTKIDRAILDRAPNLQVIITATSGFDHIDLALVEERQLRVMFTPEANAASACELTWALVLACARRVPEAHRSVKNGDWRRESLVGTELAGKTYGVVGLGRIGTRVARIAHAFGMKVIAFDPYQDGEHFTRENVSCVSLEELLKLADVISFHVPKTTETHHLVTLYSLEYLNRGAIVINTSRGSVIAEPDLIEALQKGWIAACGLDVFEKEPLPRHSPLQTFANVVLSPHLGATTHEAFAAASSEAAQKLIDFVEAGCVSDPLPPDETWYRMGFGRTGPPSGD